MMTVLIMLLLTPLTLKSTKSMLEMQRIQPEMKRIQQEYRGDRQAMNEAVMALYKEHGVNPLGGCLPMLIQAPSGSSCSGCCVASPTSPPAAARSSRRSISTTPRRLYQDLSHSTQMRAFGLDLAESAALSLKHSFVRRSAVPHPGGDRRRHLLHPAAPDHRAQQEQPVSDTPGAAQQQMIMKIFPIFSGLFAFIVPAALAWYFLVQNLFRIAQQAYITKRFYHEHPAQ